MNTLDSTFLMSNEAAFAEEITVKKAVSLYSMLIVFE